MYATWQRGQRRFESQPVAFYRVSSSLLLPLSCVHCKELSKSHKKAKTLVVYCMYTIYHSLIMILHDVHIYIMQYIKIYIYCVFLNMIAPLYRGNVAPVIQEASCHSTNSSLEGI